MGYLPRLIACPRRFASELSPPGSIIPRLYTGQFLTLDDLLQSPQPRPGHPSSEALSGWRAGECSDCRVDKRLYRFPNTDFSLSPDPGSGLPLHSRNYFINTIVTWFIKITRFSDEASCWHLPLSHITSESLVDFLKQ